MLLHELQHCKHRDSLAACLMNLAGILYWFNPFLWYALKAMKNDREVACDTSVLAMLSEDSYKDYGTTLLDFAEKVSRAPFPFATELSGNMKQMKQRILNITSYQKSSVPQKIRSVLIFILIAAFLISFAPLLSVNATSQDSSAWNPSAPNTSNVDLSSTFDGLDGSFVMYDSGADSWTVYNRENALTRVSPDSTYKIYDALFGLESGIITPEDSKISWNGDSYPFEEWNRDQNLQTALTNSVNWYFQSMDHQMGRSQIAHYIQGIGYGNQQLSGDLSSYWMESSLKISPMEQVELLTKLWQNDLDFHSAYVSSVKEALYLSSSEHGRLYGKTGTGRVNGQDMNGWFVGCVEQDDRFCIFATNIQGSKGATGSRASDLSLSILSALHIWN